MTEQLWLPIKVLFKVVLKFSKYDLTYGEFITQISHYLTFIIPSGCLKNIRFPSWVIFYRRSTMFLLHKPLNLVPTIRMYLSHHSGEKSYSVKQPLKRLLMFLSLKTTCTQKSFMFWLHRHMSQQRHQTICVGWVKKKSLLSKHIQYYDI